MRGWYKKGERKLNKMFILCGLPGSGKSTIAKKYAEDNNALIVNKDKIREMLFGEYAFKKEFEPTVSFIAMKAIEDIDDREVSFVVDECNITKQHRENVMHHVYLRVTEVVVIYVKTDIQTCIKRRTADTKGYKPEKWEEVITGMNANFEESTEEEAKELGYKLIVIEKV